VATLGGAVLKIERAADGGLIVGGQRVIRPNIASSNGLIHGLNGVITNPSNSADDDLPIEAQSGPSAIVSIPATLGADPDFSTLVAAVSAANLGASLAAEGPFTVFAPNNGAFDVLLEESGLAFEQILASPDLQMLLGSLLSNHVVAG